MKQLIVEKCIKKFTNLILMALWAIAPITAMDKPSPEQKQNNSQSSSLVVKKEFGESFDFASYLKPENDPGDRIYLRRLKAFKHFLFDYVYDLQRPAGKEVERSGSLPTYLFDYLKMAQSQRLTAKSIPILHGNLVLHFMPSRIALKTQKIAAQGDIELEICPITPSPDVVYDRIISIAHDGSKIMPFSINKTTHEYEISPFCMTNKSGKFAITPLIKKQNGKTIVSTSVPLYLITESDAESILLSLSNRSTNEISKEEKKRIIENLAEDIENLAKNDDLSPQGQKILAFAMYNLSRQTIRELTEQQQNKKNKYEALAEDQKSIQTCCLSCPYALPLKVLEKRLINLNQNFLVWQPDGTIKFSQVAETLFDDISRYLKLYSPIQSEYSILYKRVQEVIKSIKRSKIDQASKKSEFKLSITPPNTKLPSNPTTPNHAVTIKYSNRVMRWFKESFAVRQKKSSLLYHALLPLLADPIVITHGRKAYFNNKTHAGQKDDHYSIAGKIIDEGTHEESYCVFRLCIDPKGVCYHRECSTYEWENLEPELQKACAVEEEAYTVDDEQVLETDKATIIRDTPLMTTLINPRFAHKIVLFKKQF